MSYIFSRSMVLEKRCQAATTTAVSRPMPYSKTTLPCKLYDSISTNNFPVCECVCILKYFQSNNAHTVVATEIL